MRWDRDGFLNYIPTTTGKCHPYSRGRLGYSGVGVMDRGRPLGERFSRYIYRHHDSARRRRKPADERARRESRTSRTEVHGPSLQRRLFVSRRRAGLVQAGFLRSDQEHPPEQGLAAEPGRRGPRADGVGYQPQLRLARSDARYLSVAPNDPSRGFQISKAIPGLCRRNRRDRLRPRPATNPIARKPIRPQSSVLRLSHPRRGSAAHPSLRAAGDELRPRASHRPLGLEQRDPTLRRRQAHVPVAQARHRRLLHETDHLRERALSTDAQPANLRRAQSQAGQVPRAAAVLRTLLDLQRHQGQPHRVLLPWSAGRR